MNHTIREKAILAHWNFPADDEATSEYLRLLDTFTNLFQTIFEEKYSIQAFETFFSDFLKASETNFWAFLRVFHDGQVFKRSVAANSFNTGLVCFAVATVNKWSREKIQLLTRAALLHDVGMLFMPSEILNKEGMITPQERAVIESHPSISFELTRKWGEPLEVTKVAVQHHEQWDGKGYPNGLSEGEIHEFSRLVSIGITFVAMVTTRSYRNSLVGYGAIKQIIDGQNSKFSSESIKLFLNGIGVNPPGSIVLLSDGSIARVLENNKDNPLRPKIRLLVDSAGREFRADKGAVMEMSLVKKIFIARPVNFQDVLDSKANA